jgi:hypothetical protein
MNKIIGKITYLHDTVKFLIFKHWHGYTINPEPTFDPEGLSFFKSAIGNSKIYLEYGSGGSTILASQFVAKLVSVESDEVFAKAVKDALPSSDADIEFVCPYMGLTREWGFPVFGKPTARRVARWKRYPQAPWPVLGSEKPDTILVDGRMRVACALESLIHISRDTCLLVDDYAGRSYSTIENFADLVAMHGRMAEFRKSGGFNEPACRETLERAYMDLR